MTETVELPDSVTYALRILKGEPVERSVYELVRNELISKIRENESKISALVRRYGDEKKLEEKILGKPHTWEDEKVLFDWDALITENERLKKLLAEIRA